MFNNIFKIIVLIVYSAAIFGCASSARFSSTKNTKLKRPVEKRIEKRQTYIPSSSVALKYKTIRVLLEEHQSELNIAVQNEVILQDNETTIGILKPGSKLLFSYNKDYIKVESDDIDFKAPFFNLIPANNDSLIKYNNKTFRGSLNIASDTDLKLINIVSVEDYIKGVIPGEMPTGKGDEIMEAVKAFSICARTFAYMRLAEGKPLFDVFNDVKSQVYTGYKNEKKNANIAVNETSNMVLTYNNSIAYVFYSSTCGGHTEDVENVFGLKDIPYLKSVEDGTDPYCKISPAFNWKEIISKKTLVSKLKTAGLLPKQNDYKIDDIKINEKLPSGRNKEIIIEVTGDEDKEILIKGGKIRTVFSPKQGDLLKSSNFDIEMSGDEITFTGTGYGHGVGLCQYGAIGMAKEGKDYKEILEHYFPGTTITQGL
ncbi:MAG: SpoIID/LytB domain-containing protein [Bacteroidota bacterium]|nr:SpoIID/LytB domain-containing protein [Bacteroidota bacterium]